MSLCHKLGLLIQRIAGAFFDRGRACRIVTALSCVLISGTGKACLSAQKTVNKGLGDCWPRVHHDSARGTETTNSWRSAPVYTHSEVFIAQGRQWCGTLVYVHFKKLRNHFSLLKQNVSHCICMCQCCCVCACVCILILCLFCVCLLTCLSFFVCVCLCLCVCIYFICVCVHMCVCVNKCVCLHVWMFVRVCVCVYLCLCAHACVCVHEYACVSLCVSSSLFIRFW